MTENIVHAERAKLAEQLLSTCREMLAVDRNMSYRLQQIGVYWASLEDTVRRIDECDRIIETEKRATATIPAEPPQRRDKWLACGQLIRVEPSFLEEGVYVAAIAIRSGRILDFPDTLDRLREGAKTHMSVTLFERG